MAKQGQTQYAAMKFDKSLASFDEAIQLDDEGGEVLLAWQAKAKDANEKWNACEAILNEVEALFDAEDLEAAAAKWRRRKRQLRIPTRMAMRPPDDSNLAAEGWRWRSTRQRRIR